MSIFNTTVKGKSLSQFEIQAEMLADQILNTSEYIQLMSQIFFPMFECILEETQRDQVSISMIKERKKSAENVLMNTVRQADNLSKRIPVDLNAVNSVPYQILHGSLSFIEDCCSKNDPGQYRCFSASLTPEQYSTLLIQEHDITLLYNLLICNMARMIADFSFFSSYAHTAAVNISNAEQSVLGVMHSTSNEKRKERINTQENMKRWYHDVYE